MEIKITDFSGACYISQNVSALTCMKYVQTKIASSALLTNRNLMYLMFFSSSFDLYGLVSYSNRL